MKHLDTILHPMELRQHIKLIAPEVQIPGKRIPMEEGELFAIWRRQHRKGIDNIIRAFQCACPEQHSLEWNDYALNFYTTIPEIVENNLN